VLFLHIYKAIAINLSSGLISQALRILGDVQGCRMLYRAGAIVLLQGFEGGERKIIT
jgi:hypothetical protein